MTIPRCMASPSGQRTPLLGMRNSPPVLNLGCGRGLHWHTSRYRRNNRAAGAERQK